MHAPRRADPWTLWRAALGSTDALPSLLAALAACLPAAALVALLTWSGAAEDSILTGHYLPMAAWLRGDGERALLTYPLWGYPALLAVLPLPVVQVLQVAVAAAVAAWTWIALRSRTRARGLLLGLIALSVPWYALSTPRWPMGLAAALAVAFGLLLARAFERGRWGPAILAGAALGVGLNLRSELFALGAATVCAAVVGRLARRRVWRPSLGFGALAVAVALLVPWGLHYREQTGRWSWSSSNGAAVAWIALGQLPNNPWGIVHIDEQAEVFLRERGIEADPFGDAGRQVFEAELLAAVRSHPGAFARKLARNLRNALLGGLFVGSQPLPPEELTRLDVARERLKLLIGLNANQTEIEHYRRTGAWERAGVPPRAALVLLWQAAGVALGNVWLWLTLIGLWFARRSLLEDPLLGVLAAQIVALFALVAVGQYQPRHVTPIALLGAPFVCEALVRLRAAAARPRP